MTKEKAERLQDARAENAQLEESLAMSQEKVERLQVELSGEDTEEMDSTQKDTELQAEVKRLQELKLQPETKSTSSCCRANSCTCWFQIVKLS